MNKSLIIFLITLVAAIGFNMVWGLSNTLLETPEYELIKKSGSFEIRKYAPMVVARTQVSSDYSEATSRGFRRIANYIFGGNDASIEIAMTAPVITGSPVVGSVVTVIFVPALMTVSEVAKSTPSLSVRFSLMLPEASDALSAYGSESVTV